MAGSAVELDFFQMEKEKPQPKMLFDRRRSFRDIQSVISKLNPELLKSVIASGSADQSFNRPKSSFSVPSTPRNDEMPFPALPVYAPAVWSTNGGSESTPETSPLTIFYNGTVTVFNVPRNKAENILKLAEGGVSKAVDGDFPLFRRKSLQRFLEKRKERLTLVSPYGSPTDHAFWGKNSSGHQV